VLPQRPETAVAHLAVYALGAVAVPLTQLFGPEALAYRLQDSGAVLAIADESAWGALAQARAEAPALRTVVAAGAAQGATGADADWAALLAHRAPIETALATRADEAAVLIYTSGTTGPAKGALIPHRALLGNLSGFVCSQNGCPQPGDVFWSPADWAWTGGLMDALLPCLYLGVPIVALRARFSPERAFALLARHRVTNTFLFPTALKAMMKAVPRPRERFDLHLRAVMSAGEAVGDAVYHWCEQALGVTVNEMFGQTEVNYIVGNCQTYAGVDGRLHPGWPARPGSMGRAYPGHRVAVIDDAGRECPRGTPGDVALHRLDVHGQPDPIFFLGYWQRDDATRAKFSPELAAAATGSGHEPPMPAVLAQQPDTPDALDALGIARASWCRTGDIAVMDGDGYLWYQGRSDDVFKAAGYRIGPSEVENCLVKHPAVANAVVVPKPDAERGALVKAYVVLAEGHAGSAALIAELQAFVKGRLAPYEYPKEIEFIDALPMTTTGKVQRRVLRMQEAARATPMLQPDPGQALLAAPRSGQSRLRNRTGRG
jgi:acetyl-CoA synthetase